MSRTLVWLAGLLALQLALIAWLWLGRSTELASFSSDEKLLALDAGGTDRIVIEEPMQTSLELVKQGGKWVIPAANSFPAAPKKIAELLDKLADLNKSWPVATTSEAAKQLKVSKDDFNKKLTFKQGDETRSELLLGTSPGFRKVHARVEGEAPIYSIEFNAYEAPTKAEDWYDRQVLSVPRASIERLELGSLALERTESGLRLSDLSEGEEMNSEAVSSLVSSLSGLGFQEVLGVEEKPEYKLGSPVFAFNVNAKERGRITYTAGALDDKSYVLKSSELPFFFKVEKAAIDRLKDAERASLVKPREAAAPAQEDAAQSPEAQAGQEAPPAQSPATPVPQESAAAPA